MQEAVLRALEALEAVRAVLLAYPEAVIGRPAPLPILPNRALKAMVDLKKTRHLQSLTDELGIFGRRFLSLSFISVGTGRFAVELVLGPTSFFLLASELFDGYRYIGEFSEIRFDNASQTDVEPPILLLEWRE